MTFAPNAPGAWEGNGGLGADRTRGLCALAARAASSKLGHDIVVLGVEKLMGLTDAFVITAGANPRQVRTISDEVERQLKIAGNGSPLRVEGLDDARWVLMDYGDFVVHVFMEEVRQFYDLESLWGDAPRWDWDEHSGELVGASTGTGPGS